MKNIITNSFYDFIFHFHLISKYFALVRFEINLAAKNKTYQVHVLTLHDKIYFV